MCCINDLFDDSLAFGGMLLSTPFHSRPTNYARTCFACFSRYLPVNHEEPIYILRTYSLHSIQTWGRTYMVDFARNAHPSRASHKVDGVLSSLLW